MRITKGKLYIDSGKQQLYVPDGSQMLKVDIVDDELWVWYMYDPDQTEFVLSIWKIVMDDFNIPDQYLDFSYVGSAMHNGQQLHIFVGEDE